MKTLIVYYSYTGNTKKIANAIKNHLNCDILEVTPKIPFSNDYDEVVAEYQNNSIEDKSIEINDIGIDLKEYDKIIIGSPVWWYTICPVITSFLKKYDLSGKKIYPFATNAGWLGKTFKDIETLCPNSEVKRGMNIVFESYTDNLVTSKQEIDKWIKEI